MFKNKVTSHYTQNNDLNQFHTKRGKIDTDSANTALIFGTLTKCEYLYWVEKGIYCRCIPTHHRVRLAQYVNATTKFRFTDGEM